MIKLFDSALKQTEYTRLVTSLELPTKTQLVTFRSQNNDLTHDAIQKKTKQSITDKQLIQPCNQPKEITVKVTVKIIEIQWLLRGFKNFLDFAPILESYEKENLFQTEFMRALTNEYWVNYQKQIILWTLLPWIAFSLSSLAYFAKYLDRYNDSLTGKLFLGTFVILLSLYQLYIEAK